MLRGLILKLLILRKIDAVFGYLEIIIKKWNLLNHFKVFCNVINCSQTKFVAIILVLSVFFYAIFRLTNFSSDAFDFSSSKTG